MLLTICTKTFWSYNDASPRTDENAVPGGAADQDRKNTTHLLGNLKEHLAQICFVL